MGFHRHCLSVFTVIPDRDQGQAVQEFIMGQSLSKENFSRKRWLVVISVVFGLVLLGGGGYYYWTGTPRYSLYQMGKAIKNHDSETFLLYLDIDRIVDGLAESTSKKVEDNVSPPSPSESSKHERLSRRSRDIVRALLPQVLKSLKPILKKQIQKVVEEVGRKNKISPLAFCMLSDIEKKGGIAEVRVKTKKEQTFHFTMERTPQRIWKVVGIDINVLDFV
ncbi:MAG: hypothetical protein V2A69_10440 [Pseudomonadota bacterium]